MVTLEQFQANGKQLACCRALQVYAAFMAIGAPGGPLPSRNSLAFSLYVCHK